MNILVEQTNRITVITINRPEVKNAVDRDTSRELAEAFKQFDENPESDVAILTGSEGVFCAGADLKALSLGKGNRITKDGDGPMGPTRLTLSKPTIAAIEGFAVAGGLELAIWCDLRVASEKAILGVYCRRWGVPLVDGGTIRLPRMIGMSHALDLIITGRGVAGEEAKSMGLINRLCKEGESLEVALEEAENLLKFPQICMRNDRLSAYKQWNMSLEDAINQETELGLEVINSGESIRGASRFTEGKGRHGSFDDN